jgi:hypothetical protein
MHTSLPSSGAHNYRALNNNIRNYSAIIASPRDHKLLSQIVLLFNTFYIFNQTINGISVYNIRNMFQTLSITSCMH